MIDFSLFEIPSPRSAVVSSGIFYKDDLAAKKRLFLYNISNTKDSVSSGYPNTEKRVENTTCGEVFLRIFEVFGLPMKHCLLCLIYLLNQNKN